jgi:pimeloyl-ACP methyl ester carboxylesterase
MRGSMRAMTWTTVRAADTLPPKERLQLARAGGTEGDGGVEARGLEGCELAYLSRGEALQPTIIWVHGFPANSYLWRGCLPVAEAAGFRSVAPDLLGTGESTAPQACDFSLRVQARCLDILIERLQLDRILLVAEGIGVYVCEALGLLKPHRIHGLVLIDPPALSGTARFRGVLGLLSVLARGGAGRSILRAMRLSRSLDRLHLEPADADARAGVNGVTASSLGRDLYLRPLLSTPESRARTVAFLASLRLDEAAAIHDGFVRWNRLPVVVCKSPPSDADAAPSASPPTSTVNTVDLPSKARRLIEETPSEFFEILRPHLLSWSSSATGTSAAADSAEVQ